MLLAISCWTFVRVFVGASATVALENIALRHQRWSARASTAATGISRTRHPLDGTGAG